MHEPHVEEVGIHDDPESCSDKRSGLSAGGKQRLGGGLKPWSRTDLAEPAVHMVAQ